MLPQPAEPPPLKEAPKFEGLKKHLGSDEARTLALASSLGLALVAALFIGTFLGWTLDQKLGSTPWLSLLGFLIGLAAGFKNLFAFSARLTRQERPPRTKPDGLSPSNHDEPG